MIAAMRTKLFVDRILTRLLAAGIKLSDKERAQLTTLCLTRWKDVEAALRIIGEEVANRK